MQSVKIDVTKIDKTAIVHGEKGKYMNLTLIENRNGPDQYDNDGFVVQDLGKERRLAGEKGPIIGNWRHVKAAKPKQDAHNEAKSNAYQPEPDKDVPF
jgi:hypothetical protein